MVEKNNIIIIGELIVMFLLMISSFFVGYFYYEYFSSLPCYNISECTVGGLYFSGNDTVEILLSNRTYSEFIESCNHEYLHYKWGIEHFSQYVK